MFRDRWGIEGLAGVFISGVGIGGVIGIGISMLVLVLLALALAWLALALVLLVLASSPLLALYEMAMKYPRHKNEIFNESTSYPYEITMKYPRHKNEIPNEISKAIDATWSRSPVGVRGSGDMGVPVVPTCGRWLLFGGRGCCCRPCWAFTVIHLCGRGGHWWRRGGRAELRWWLWDEERRCFTICDMCDFGSTFEHMCA